MCNLYKRNGNCRGCGMLRASHGQTRAKDCPVREDIEARAAEGAAEEAAFERDLEEWRRAAEVDA